MSRYFFLKCVSLKLVILCLCFTHILGVSTTFKTCSKTPEKYREFKNMDGKSMELLTKSEKYEEIGCIEILKSSKFSNQTRLMSNGFVDTILTSYSLHHNLVIRPDDVWTAIMVQFSFYINKHAEKYRSQFVSHKGKKKLVVKIPGSLRNAPYDLFVKQMSVKIDKNLVDPKVKSWILPSFSTTTDEDMVTCGVVFMAAMKQYFSYGMSMMCGIPYVTLEGTAKDWEDILGRLKKLKEYDLSWWYGRLKPILKQFVAAKKGDQDSRFWGTIVNRIEKGSGMSYLSGWITAFAVFDVDGNKIGFQRQGAQYLHMNSIPSGSVDVDVEICDNGVKYKSVMFAGHLAMEIVDKERTTLAPKTGWAICLKSEEDRKLKKVKKVKNVLPVYTNITI